MPCDLRQAGKANSYAQHFEAMARDLPWRPALADGRGTRFNPRPTAPGVQTAIVVGPEGETTPGASGPLHTDGLGRLKVKFHTAFQSGSAATAGWTTVPVWLDFYSSHRQGHSP